MATTAKTLEEVREMGYDDVAIAARDSGVAGAPADGWDGWLPMS
jgi:hypothetical protein